MGEVKQYRDVYAKQIDKLLTQAREEIPAKKMQEEGIHHISKDRLIDRLNHPYPYGPFGVCYIKDNNVVGTAIYLDHKEFVYFKLIIVDRDNRNLKIGGSLMDWFIMQFENRPVISQTFESNTPMKRLFAQHGFKLSTSITNDRKNGDNTEWYELNSNSKDLIKAVLAGEFDLCY